MINLGTTVLLGFLVGSVLAAETAILIKLQLVRSILLVLGRCIVSLLALGASESDDVTHRLTS